MSYGKVFLVGAGPGDPGLITVRAVELLRKADSVIYDRLVNPLLLEFTKPGCRLIYAGKKAGVVGIRQEEINKLILEEASISGCVVRLKGGDPYLFGRGGEEAEMLASNGIEFGVVPGITSAIGVPAYSAIPVTHRNFSSSLTIITGHEPGNISLPRLSREDLRRNTLAILMGNRDMSALVKRLFELGYDGETPVAVIVNGTYSTQETYVGTLSNIAEQDPIHDMNHPAMILVGNVVRAREKLLPLYMSIERKERIIYFSDYSDSGSPVLIKDHADAEIIRYSSYECEWINLDQVPLFLDRIKNSNRIIFSHGDVVKRFFQLLGESGVDLRDLPDEIIALPSGLSELRRHGITRCRKLIETDLPGGNDAKSLIVSGKTLENDDFPGTSENNIRITILRRKLKNLNELQIQQLNDSSKPSVVFPLFDLAKQIILEMDADSLKDRKLYVKDRKTMEILLARGLNPAMLQSDAGNDGSAAKGESND